MSRADILKRRAVSDAYRYAERSGRKDSPWHQWPDMMFRKTVLIGGLNHGSVPQDLGVGGMLTAEQEDDRAEDAAKPLPKPTQGQNIRATLGLDKPEPFAMAEQAVAAIAACKTIGELESLRSRMQDFTGADAETVADAYAAKEQEL